MKADPYPSVRLTVVHALSTTDPTIAKRLLRAFTKAPDPMVAGKAKRYFVAT